MANIKITELNAAGSLAATDVVPVVDVSADETKKITATDLFRTLPDGTAAAPALAFSSDAANGVYLAGTDTVGISTGGTQRVTVDGSGNVTISGDLQVDGATTTVQSTTVTIDDKNIELGSVASPSNTTADGGGITLKGATDKTLKWINSTGCWTFNQPMNFNDHVRIDSSGNVGIKSTNPLAQLHILNTSGTSGFYISRANGTAVGDQISLQLLTDSAKPRITGYGDGLAFFTAATSGTASERMRLTYDGRLGLGTSSPNNAFLLDVATGAVRSDGNGFYVSENYSTNNNVYRIYDNSSQFAIESQIYGNTTNASAPIVFRTSSSDGRQERLRIDSSGNVGIGTSSSGTKLEVKDTTVDGTPFKITGANNYGYSFRSLAAGGINGARLDLHIGSSAGAYSFTNSSSELLRIDNSGDIGVGSTTPNKNNWNKAITLQGGSNCAYELSDNGVLAAAFALQGDDRIELINFRSGPLTFKTNNTERLRIDSSGRLLLGTTTAGDANADGLTIHRSSNTGITIRTGDSSNGNIFFDDSSGVARGSIEYNHSSDLFKFNTAGTGRLYIDSSGRVGIGTGSPDSTLELAAGPPRLKLTRNTTASTGNDFGRIVFENSAATEVSRIDSTSTSGNTTPALRFSNNGSEAMRIDSSQRLLVGTSSARSKFFNNSSLYSGKLQVEGTSESTRIISLVHNTSNAAFPILVLGKSRGTSAGSHTVAQNGDGLGSLSFQGADGSELVEAASIKSEVDGTPGSNDMPGRLVFSTSADGASSTTERLRITSTGAWGIEGASNYGTSGQVLTSNGNDSPTWQEPAGAGAVGGGTDKWVVETDQTVTTSYELTAGKHGMTVSPTINSGATITVPSGAILVIL